MRLAIGSNAASIWWLNGQEVIGIYNDRQTVIDDGVSKRLTLKKGPNVIRAAIVNAGGATDFCARFLDGDDNPVKGIVVSLDADGTARRQRSIDEPADRNWSSNRGRVDRRHAVDGASGRGAEGSHAEGHGDRRGDQSAAERRRRYRGR